MKVFITLSALLVAASAHTLLLKDNFIPITSLKHEIGHGSYNVEALSGDGTMIAESGHQILPAGFLDAGAAKTGSFSWTSPEGIPFAMSYVADENGFRPVASHLPIPPPMPEDIRSMLPTLPKLIETEPLSLIRAAPFIHHAPIHHVPIHHPHHLVRTALPVEVIQAEAPIKTFVQTESFLIDSDMSKTMVRIGL